MDPHIFFESVFIWFSEHVLRRSLVTNIVVFPPLSGLRVFVYLVYLSTLYDYVILYRYFYSFGVNIYSCMVVPI